MSARKNRAIYLTAITPRQWTARISIVFLIITSLLLMVMSQVNSQTTTRLRTQILDIFVPVISVASKPLNAVASFASWASEMSLIRSENIALKNANIQLLQWQSTAKNLEAENNSLRSLMNVIPLPKKHYITTRIVTDMSGPYVRSALIAGGVQQGIKRDQAVVSEYGLVGRVVETGSSSSRVLLLNDINSRIPVMFESTRQKAILTGNNNELPSLSYVATDNDVKIGERIITSGDGGIFPRGIVVGKVSKVEKNLIRIQPAVDSTNIEYVNVVDYSL
jgi:rod shape-determining protein MreC